MSEIISCRSGVSLYPPVMVIQPSPIAETSGPSAPRVRLSMVHAPVLAGEPFPAAGDHLTTPLCPQGGPLTGPRVGLDASRTLCPACGADAAWQRLRSISTRC